MLIQPISHGAYYTDSATQAGFRATQGAGLASSAYPESVASVEAGVSQDLAALTQVVANINQVMKDANAEVKFYIDQQAREIVIKVVDKETQATIRQMTIQEVASVAHKLHRLQGVLLSQHA